MSNHFIPIHTADLVWKDGLPYSSQFQDIYYSKEGGLEQCRYVFIAGNKLHERWLALPKDKITYFTIAETGFGTGLNFLVTWQLWEQLAPPDARLHFISCDKHPLSVTDLAECLKQWPELETQANLLIASYPVLTPGNHHLSFLDGRITLTLMLGDAIDCFEQLLLCGDSTLEAQLRTSFIDAWYLDGFAPRRNAEMWSEKLIKVVAMLSSEGTSIATYTAAQTVKTALVNAGFTLEKKKGFGPKRHMITGALSRVATQNLKVRHTPWHVPKSASPNEKKVVIIGAGLAGCFTAYALAKRGWDVTLIDENESLAKGASAIQQAVLFPKLSAYRSPLTQFMLDAFLYAQKFYTELLSDFNVGELNGSLLLGHNIKEVNAQKSLVDWLDYYPELGELIDSSRATELAGVPVQQSALLIPLSGWINSPAICQVLVNNPGITVKKRTIVDRLIYDQGSWYINDVKTPVVILTNGYKLNQFEQTNHFPVKPIRGQMTTILSSTASKSIKIPICADGHVLPALNGSHHFGATYGLGVDTLEISTEDDLLNRAKLKAIADIAWSADEVVDHWAGIRASTPDYLPLVGQAPKADEFKQVYKNLETNAKRWIASPGPYYQGLYVCAGFGSRGLTTIPLCSEWLAANLDNEISFLPRHLIQAISPSRFLRKDIIRGLHT